MADILKEYDHICECPHCLLNLGILDEEISTYGDIECPNCGHYFVVEDGESS